VVEAGKSTTIIAELDTEGLDGEIRKTIWGDLAWEGEPGFKVPLTDLPKQVMPKLPPGATRKVVEVKVGTKVVALEVKTFVRATAKLSANDLLFVEKKPQSVSLAGTNAQAKITGVEPPASSLYGWTLTEDKRSLTLMPHEARPLGSRVENWLVKTDDAKTPALKLRVRSHNQAAISVLPNEILLRGGQERAQVLLRPAGKKLTFKVLSCELQGSAGSIKSEPRSKNGWRIVVEAVKEDRGSLKIKTDCPALPELVVPMRRVK